MSIYIVSSEEERFGEAGSIGIMQGVSPGRKIHHAGVLDLRRVPAEEVARIEEIGSATIVLLDEENRMALRGVKMHHVRSILVAAPDERVLVTPQLDLSYGAVAAMPAGQKLLLIGNVLFSPEIPADLIAEKFASIRIFGILIAGAGALGALVGRSLFGNGVTVALPEDSGPIVRDTGETNITNDYLSEIADDVTYLNFGEVNLDSNVSPDLLRRKIRAYYNLGETKGKSSLLAILRARCPLNTGEFE